MASTMKHITASMRKACEGCATVGAKTSKGLCKACSLVQLRIQRSARQRRARARVNLPPYFALPHSPVRATCRECGHRFERVPASGKTLQVQIVYCSRLCQKRSSDRVRTKARRAATRGAKVVDKVDATAIFVRDGWRCQSCRRKTPRQLRGSCDPSAPELDHINSLASGGAHTWANTQCLCRACNQAKGASSFGQLHLPLTA
jgi:5-methylcytosine-specific restriction endonuclease McrA